MRDKKLSNTQYLEIYTKAHNNAGDLLREAELLFEHNYFARAYALAFTALEEISKSQSAADVFTGFQKPEDFDKVYSDHKQKIKGIMWAHDDANSYTYNLKWIGPDIDDVIKINPKEPLFQKRQRGLFVDIDFDTLKIISPNEEVTEQDARGIIHIVETALKRIWEITEYWGHQIGTKGFLK